MSFCARPMVAAKNGGREADDRDHVHRDRARAVKISRGARDHVDAGGHHGRGVDQRGDRRGTGHRVRQPDVQRNLRRLAAGAHQQQQADRGEHPALGSTGMPCLANTLAKSSEPKLHDDQEHRQREAEVADAVDDERLVAGVGGELLRGSRSRSAGSCTGPRLPSRRTAAGKFAPSTSISMKNMNRFR